MEEKLKKVSQDFLERIKKNLPAQKPAHLFVLGTVGLIGSGKSTAAAMLNKNLPGTVLVKSNSARFLLKEADLSWGENVRKLTFDAARWLLQNGYSVVFDGDLVEEEKRKNTQALADEFGAKFYLVRIKPDKDLAFGRLQQMWADIESGTKKQDFENFNPVVRGKEQNLFDRISLHETLDVSAIPQLIGEIDNGGDFDSLKMQVQKLIEKIG